MDKQSKESYLPDKIVELLGQYRFLKAKRKEANDKHRQILKERGNDSYYENVVEIEDQILSINEDIEQNKRDIDSEITAYSESLLKKIRKKQNVKLKTFLLGSKTAFCANDFESEIIISLIKSDIRLHYKRIPADRNNIVEQLKGILDNGMPKYIIRADVESCFEYVPFQNVINKLEREGYVSNTTLWYLKSISKQAEDLEITGVPRGLSFSSDLVEIFFQNIDMDIRLIPGAYFYKRYVDDIIIVLSAGFPFNEKSKSNNLEYLWLTLREIFSKHGLTLHENSDKKTTLHVGNGTKCSFNYLGYKFCINSGSLRVRMSDNKVQRYEDAIGKIIGHYNKTAHDNESLPNPQGNRRRKREQPLRRLFGQLAAITGNGMLAGNKSNLLTGIYYSNCHLTSTADLKKLDKILRVNIDTKLKFPDNLFKYSDNSDFNKTSLDIKCQLKRWSFEEGFLNRRFCKNARFCKRMKEIKNLG